MASYPSSSLIRPYFDSVATKAAFERELTKSPAAAQHLANLCRSTGSWGREQLIASRVIVPKTDGNLLPCFQDDPDDDCAHLLRHLQRENLSLGPSSDPFWHDKPDARVQLYDLIEGPPHSYQVTTTLRSERALVRSLGPSLGPLWAALNNLCQTPDATFDIGADGQDGETNVPKPHPLLPSSPPHPMSPDAFRDSSSPLRPAIFTAEARHDRQDSSSPLLPPPKRSRRQAARKVDDAASPQDVRAYLGTSTPERLHPASSQGYIDNAESTSTPYRSEDLTIRFASSFIRHTLYHIPFQHNEIEDPSGAVVDFDDHKRRLKVDVGGNVGYVSIDDGGLQLVYDKNNRAGRVAILEAKRFLGSVHDGKPVLSDERFAQMVGEALASRLVYGAWSGLDETVFVVAAARYYMRFFQMTITDEYLNQFQAHAVSPEAPFDHYVMVHATSWFDLRETDGRSHAVNNIAGIVQRSIPV